MVSKIILFLTVIALLALIAETGLFFYRDQQKNAIKEEVYACSTDTDCISVKSGCCDCASGGANTAVNRNYLGIWKKNLEEKCSVIGCFSINKNDWTCSAKPKCFDGRCQLER